MTTEAEDRESLLWALSEVGDQALREEATVPDETFADKTLMGYREGSLPEEEMRCAEAQLVRDPALRRQLAEFAGATVLVAPEAVRRRVLASAAAPSAGSPAARSPAAGRPAVRRWWRWPTGLAAAAVIVLAVGWLAIRPGLDPAFPPGLDPTIPPAYDITLRALSDRRGDPPPATGVEASAYPGTRVEITATVAGRAVPGFDVALYRWSGERLERVSAELLSREEQRGAVRFEASAATLAGSEPGVRPIYVVIAAEDDLPAAVEAADDPEAALAAGGHRRVHRLTLYLQEEP